MRIAVFGASGGTGREVVHQALAAGHDVTAMIRNAGTALLEANPHLHIVVGDFSRQEIVQQVVSGQDAVISALGTNEKGPVTVCTDGVQAILAAMKSEGVRRIAVVSAHGAAESHDHSLYVLAVWAFMKNKMRDKESMEALIRAADVDWTIVRPPALTDGPKTATYRTGTDLKIRITSRISRADLADFLIKEATRTAHVDEMPRIAA